jgi:hypothetical protein
VLCPDRPQGTPTVASTSVSTASRQKVIQSGRVYRRRRCPITYRDGRRIHYYQNFYRTKYYNCKGTQDPLEAVKIVKASKDLAFDAAKTNGLTLGTDTLFDQHQVRISRVVGPDTRPNGRRRRMGSDLYGRL